MPAHALPCGAGKCGAGRHFSASMAVVICGSALACAQPPGADGADTTTPSRSRPASGSRDRARSQSTTRPEPSAHAVYVSRHRKRQGGQVRPVGRVHPDVRRRSQRGPRGGDVCTAASGDLCKEGEVRLLGSAGELPVHRLQPGRRGGGRRIRRTLGRRCLCRRARPRADLQVRLLRAPGRGLGDRRPARSRLGRGHRGRCFRATCSRSTVGRASALRVFDADGVEVDLISTPGGDLGKTAWRSTPRVAITRSAATPR